MSQSTQQQQPLVRCARDRSQFHTRRLLTVILPSQSIGASCAAVASLRSVTGPVRPPLSLCPAVLLCAVLLRRGFCDFSAVSSSTATHCCVRVLLIAPHSVVSSISLFLSSTSAAGADGCAWQDRSSSSNKQVIPHVLLFLSCCPGVAASPCHSSSLRC